MKSKNKIVFKIKTAYKLKSLTPETMRLLEKGEKDVDKDKDIWISLEMPLINCKFELSLSWNPYRVCLI